jgi:hypothetical protein
MFIVFNKGSIEIYTIRYCAPTITPNKAGRGFSCATSGRKQQPADGLMIVPGHHQLY